MQVFIEHLSGPGEDELVVSLGRRRVCLEMKNSADALARGSTGCRAAGRRSVPAVRQVEALAAVREKTQGHKSQLINVYFDGDRRPGSLSDSDRALFNLSGT